MLLMLALESNSKLIWQPCLLLVDTSVKIHSLELPSPAQKMSSMASESELATASIFVTLIIGENLKCLTFKFIFCSKYKFLNYWLKGSLFADTYSESSKSFSWSLKSFKLFLFFEFFYVNPINMYFTFFIFFIYVEDMHAFYSS